MQNLHIAERASGSKRMLLTSFLDNMITRQLILASARYRARGFSIINGFKRRLGLERRHLVE